MRVLKKQEKLKEALQKTFLFRDGAEDYAELALKSEQSEYVVFEAGEAIYSVERYRKAVAFLYSGQAAAYRPNSGGCKVLLNWFSAGAMFGMAAVFAENEQYVTQVIAKKTCRVLFLPQDLLCSLFYQNPMIAQRYISFLSGRITYLNRKIAGFTAGEAEHRLAFYLCDLLQTYGMKIELPCSATALCAMLNIGRASLYRAFDRLTALGAIKRNGKVITITDREQLQAACSKDTPKDAAAGRNIRKDL